MGDLVSIIMPVYNSEKYIEKSIQSVLEQTYTAWELVVVDDCGTDKSMSIVEKYRESNSNIHVVRNEFNKGVAYSRNIGIAHANGRFICFLDSDDIMNKEKLEKQIGFMKQYNIAFCYTNYCRINEKDIIIKNRIELPSKANRECTICMMPMLISTTMIDSKRILKNKIRFPSIQTSEDRACFAEILKQIPYAVLLDDVLTSYRIHQESLSKNWIKNAMNTWRYYRKIEYFGVICSLKYFAKYMTSAINKRF